MPSLDIFIGVFQINMTDRLVDFYIDVSNSSDGSSAEQCAYDGVPYQSAETRIYSCPSNIYGQFIRIRFSPNVTRTLQLCEVQVQGGKWMKFIMSYALPKKSSICTIICNRNDI